MARGFAVWVVVGVIIGAGCGDDGPKLATFGEACTIGADETSDCQEGLRCLRDVCTVTCSVDEHCTDIDVDYACIEGWCDIPCTVTSECNLIDNERYYCEVASGTTGRCLPR